jgi:hypothetical protein
MLVPEARVGLVLHVAALCATLLAVDSLARTGQRPELCELVQDEPPILVEAAEGIVASPVS